MPITYSWYIEGHVVLMQAQGEITLEDITRENDIMQEYMDQAKGSRLHVIADQTHVEKMPDMKILAASKWVKDPRMGWFIFCHVHSRLFKFMIAVGTQFFRMRNRVVETVPQAEAFLRTIDDQLPEKVTS